MNAPLPEAAGIRPQILVIMGVSGCGKTTVAEGLHNILGWPYQEGDLLHPRANVEKMAAGIPLTDEDRWPWLAQCRAWIEARIRDGGGGILTCSALKRAYRDVLRQGDMDPVVFVYLKVPESILKARLARRTGHYMPPSLLPSQLATLEEPTADEHALVIESENAPAEVIAKTIGQLKYRIKR
ncbi:carbohydrate kinase, thermoresistant glucokinase family [Gluconacetobacter diazotrophicus PA1 5]|uniref:Gluconokinase n=1 Tax=Gluconacetobacter diazotrophicus (strain ATCC 49037 / DSM 5601 / CCUG 37298 / CIP 103539 / LMG 7603 / PAl5) TaxID=272568 RepID=A9H341_GLUDA|nr:gluconokinase [Gluconacetobacter diazotrophicus]ACI52110.1 carbohydrate kinase, thermoresistant glucokinase family [Gluconacetobacter diazotrophicus PA1 5]TWB02819.1 gluconokinase [Gluconacetobacter diazotrophicus]CAP54236.1 putative shikimate kinase [Gluconacetobacter diazotrophicus PA1 5]